MSKYTPGPWVVGRHDDGGPCVHTDEQEPWFIADICEPEEVVPTAANAKLIAAAPNLLFHLQDMVGRFTTCAVHGGSDREYVDIATGEARAAIRAATE